MSYIFILSNQLKPVSSEQIVFNVQLRHTSESNKTGEAMLFIRIKEYSIPSKCQMTCWLKDLP